MLVTRKLAEGDLKQRVEPSTRDELGRLAVAFNIMADKLADAEALRKAMVSDIAHELRTPLSCILGYLGALQDGVTVPDRELVNSLHEEATLLSHMVNDLQDLSLADAGQLTLSRQAVAIQDIVWHAVGILQSKAASKELALQVDVPTTLPRVYADPARLSQIFHNLLANAIAYTTDKGIIAVSANLAGAAVEVQIRDSGIGVRPEHLPYIFERFYRVDQSRTLSTGGTGLGLAITKHLVELQGGQIRVESTLGQGSLFTFTVPIVR